MESESKKSCKTLFDKAMKEFEIGNYRLAQKTCRQIIDSKPSDDLREKTGNMLERLRYDRIEILLGAFAFGLLTTLYIYFGFIK